MKLRWPPRKSLTKLIQKWCQKIKKTLSQKQRKYNLTNQIWTKSGKIKPFQLLQQRKKRSKNTLHSKKHCQRASNTKSCLKMKNRLKLKSTSASMRTKRALWTTGSSSRRLSSSNQWLISLQVKSMNRHIKCQGLVVEEVRITMLSLPLKALEMEWH